MILISTDWSPAGQDGVLSQVARGKRGRACCNCTGPGRMVVSPSRLTHAITPLQRASTPSILGPSDELPDHELLLWTAAGAEGPGADEGAWIAAAKCDSMSPEATWSPPPPQGEPHMSRAALELRGRLSCEATHSGKLCNHAPLQRPGRTASASTEAQPVSDLAGTIANPVRWAPRPSHSKPTGADPRAPAQVAPPCTAAGGPRPTACSPRSSSSSRRARASAAAPSRATGAAAPMTPWCGNTSRSRRSSRRAAASAPSPTPPAATRRHHAPRPPPHAHSQHRARAPRLPTGRARRRTG